MSFTVVYLKNPENKSMCCLETHNMTQKTRDNKRLALKSTTAEVLSLKRFNGWK